MSWLAQSRNPFGVYLLDGGLKKGQVKNLFKWYLYHLHFPPTHLYPRLLSKLLKTGPLTRFLGMIRGLLNSTDVQVPRAAC